MKKLIYAVLSRFFLTECSDYNPLKVRKSCRSKAQCRAAFAKTGLPFAKGLSFLSPLKAVKFARKIGFPLVIKPNVGGFSRGAYFPINSYSELLKASIGVKKWWAVSIVEQYLFGKNYRIVMTENGVMSAVQRHPPFIVGNGTSNISELIDAENHIRKTMGLYPVMSPIPKNRLIKKSLKKQSLNFTSVPQKNQTIILHPKISLPLGSTIEIIGSSKIHPDNLAKLQKILAYFEANILGIDVICEQDLSVDFNQQNCIFLELNSRPFLKMHDYPRYGKAVDLSDFYQKLNQIKLNDNHTF